MFTEEILKQKTNQDLRKIRKDLNCAHYGVKATIIKWILDILATSDTQVEAGNPPTETEYADDTD